MGMLCTAEEMLAAERSAFASGSTAESLMEEAGEGIARAATKLAPRPGICEVHFGKGHNGGDVLAAARHLARTGWKTVEKPAFPQEDLAPLSVKMLGRLRDATASHSPPPFGSVPLLVLDGILGIGVSGEPRGPAASAIAEIRAARASRGALVLSADIPSGLDADAGWTGGLCVEADCTATVGCPKRGLLADSAARFVGRIELVGLAPLRVLASDFAGITLPDLVNRVLPPRPADLHKGLCGRVSIIAGSLDFPGAARLASAAAVRAGAGLITLFAQPEIYPALAVACAPEVMVRETKNLREALDLPCDAMAIGPGCGFARESEILSIVRDAACPLVVDADALTALSRDLPLLSRAKGPRLLTPHPGEMARMVPADGKTRSDWAGSFSRHFPGCTLLLKGTRTIICTDGKPTLYNPTGNPGMASGGMGDVLTGTCAAIAAQVAARGGTPDFHEIAAAGAWICGTAADIAIRWGDSPESLSAATVIAHLGLAFNEVRETISAVPDTTA